MPNSPFDQMLGLDKDTSFDKMIESKGGVSLDEMLGIEKPEADKKLPPDETLIVNKQSEINPREFYSSSAISPPIQGLAPMIWSPGISAQMGRIGLGPKPEGGWSEAGVPLDKEGKPYLEEPKPVHLEPGIYQDQGSLWDKYTKFFRPNWSKRVAKSVNSMVQAEATGKKPSMFEHTLAELAKAGVQQSATGIIYRQKLPEVEILEQSLSTTERLIYKAASLGADLPLMIVGATIGTLGGGPIVPLTAMGGAFALPAGLRSVYVDKLMKGEVKNFKDFWGRLSHATLDTLKGETTGMATAAAGGVGGYPLEIAAMTMVGSALEGQVPTLEDVFDAAILVGGLKGATAISGSLLRMYEVTGEHPKIVVDRVIKEVVGDAPLTNEILDVAKAKAAEIIKKQADLEFARVAEKLDKDTLIAEDWAMKEENLKKAKLRPVTITGLDIKKPTEAQIRKNLGEPPKVKGAEYLALGEEGLHYWNVETVKGVTTVTTKTLDVKEVRKKVADVKKLFKESKPTQTKMSPREYQEKFPEKTVHLDWDKANSPRFVFEGAGDILRELQKETIDPEYIREKLNRISKFFNERHPDDTLEAAKKYAPDKLAKLISEYKDQPVETEAQQIAKDAIIALMEGRNKEAKELYDKIDKRVDSWVKPIKAEPPDHLKIKRSDEEITDLDRQTGTRIEALEGERSPFFQDKETAETFGKLYAEREKSVNEDPELFTQKLINDANRWYNGKDIDIAQVRDRLRIMSAHADSARSYFDTGADHLQWKEIVKEASIWASKLERPKSGINLNAMIPLEEIPKAVEKFFESVHNRVMEIGEKGFKEFGQIPYASLYRNKGLWEKTGFWLGQDGMWRFEIDPNKANYKFPVIVLKRLAESKVPTTKVKANLIDVLDYPELYENVPKMKETKLVFDSRLAKAEGKFSPGTNTIYLRGFGDRKVLEHEIQHAVNDAVGSTFLGTSVDAEVSKVLIERLKAIKSKLTDYHTKEGFQDIIDMLESTNDIEFFYSRQLPFLNRNKISLGIADEFIRDLNFPTGGGELYKRNLGEIEARVAEKRMEMSAEQRAKEAPWETLDKMLDEEGIISRTGFKLYSGIDFTKYLKDISLKLKNVFADKIVQIDPNKVPEEYRDTINRSNRFHKAFEEARAAKDFDLYRLLNRLGFHTYRAVHEKSGMIRNELNQKYGELGQKVMRNADAENGSVGHAQVLIDIMLREAYDGVPKGLDKAIDAVNYVQRLKDIYGYKSTKQFRPPKGADPGETAAYDTLLNVYHKLTPEQRAQAEKASNILFDHVKMWVDMMVEAGLKSKEEGEALKSHNYRKMRSIDIENLYDEKYKVRVGDKIVRQSDSGVDPLGTKPISIVETDSRILYNETAKRIARRLDNQETKMSWVEFEKANVDNPFIYVPENERARVKEAKEKGIPYGSKGVPKGWVKDYWFKDGRRKAMFFHPDVAAQLMTKGGHTSSQLTRFLTHALGINATRFLAVGSSTLWAATRGLSMDMVHTFFAARRYLPNGKTQRIYPKNAPQYVAEMVKDMDEVAHDVWTRGPLYEHYAKNGGMMPFLAMREANFIGYGVKPPGRFNKMLDAMTYGGVSFELWNRIAVMHHEMKRVAIEKGLSIEEAYKNREDVKKAANISVQRLPYPQGGWLAKELDKIAGPFISASYNASRTFFRSVKENPVDFAARLSNVAAPAIGITIASALLAPETEDEVPVDVHTRNAVIPIMPNTISFLDEEGNRRTLYFKVPLDPPVAAIYNIFRVMTQKGLYELGMRDSEPDYVTIIKALAGSAPLEDYPMGSSIRALLTYAFDINWWRDNTFLDEKFSWPKSEIEGKYDPQVSQLAKDIGETTKLSPRRIQRAVKQFPITNNEYTYVMGKIYEKLNNELDPELTSRHWMIELSQVPGIKNLIGVTVPKSKIIEGGRKDVEIDAFERASIREKINADIEAYYWKGIGSEDKIFNAIAEIERPDMRESLEKTRAFAEKTSELPNRRFWVGRFHLTPEAKAMQYFRLWKATAPTNRDNLELELGDAVAVGFLGRETYPRFLERLDSLMEEFEELKKTNP